MRGTASALIIDHSLLQLRDHRGMIDHCFIDVTCEHAAADQTNALAVRMVAHHTPEHRSLTLGHDGMFKAENCIGELTDQVDEPCFAIKIESATIPSLVEPVGNVAGSLRETRGKHGACSGTVLSLTTAKFAKRRVRRRSDLGLSTVFDNDLAQNAPVLAPNPAVALPVPHLVGDHISKICDQGDIVGILIDPSCGDGITTFDQTKAIFSRGAMDMALRKVGKTAISAQRDL